MNGDLFVPIQTRDALRCEGGCDANAEFQLANDRNGAFVCHECADEFGTAGSVGGK